MITVNTENPQSAIKVFYDGQCPLCRREIRFYQGLQSIASIEWIDINYNQAEIDRYGLDLEKAMARFHVLDAQGAWQTGAYGFAALWSRLPGWRWLALALVKLRLLPMADRIYSLFARWRLQRNCSNRACGS